MVGLPGSGKTQWALKYTKENPEKRYNVLGAETVLNQMRVSSLAVGFALEVPRSSHNLFPVELIFQISENKGHKYRNEFFSIYVKSSFFSFCYVVKFLKVDKI